MSNIAIDLTKCQWVDYDGTQPIQCLEGICEDSRCFCNYHKELSYSPEEAVGQIAIDYKQGENDG